MIAILAVKIEFKVHKSRKEVKIDMLNIQKTIHQVLGYKEF